MGIRQWANDRRVDHTEDSGGYANSQRQCRNRDDGKAWRTTELAQRVAKILEERVHGVGSLGGYSLRRTVMGSTLAAACAGSSVASRAMVSTASAAIV